MTYNITPLLIRTGKATIYTNVLQVIQITCSDDLDVLQTVLLIAALKLGKYKTIHNFLISFQTLII